MDEKVIPVRVELSGVSEAISSVNELAESTNKIPKVAEQAKNSIIEIDRSLQQTSNSANGLGALESLSGLPSALESSINAMARTITTSARTMQEAMKGAGGAYTDQVKIAEAYLKNSTKLFTDAVSTARELNKSVNPGQSRNFSSGFNSALHDASMVFNHMSSTGSLAMSDNALEKVLRNNGIVSSGIKRLSADTGANEALLYRALVQNVAAPHMRSDIAKRIKGLSGGLIDPYALPKPKGSFYDRLPETFRGLSSVIRASTQEEIDRFQKGDTIKYRKTVEENRLYNELLNELARGGNGKGNLTLERALNAAGIQTRVGNGSRVGLPARLTQQQLAYAGGFVHRALNNYLEGAPSYLANMSHLSDDEAERLGAKRGTVAKESIAAFRLFDRLGVKNLLYTQNGQSLPMHTGPRNTSYAYATTTGAQTIRPDEYVIPSVTLSDFQKGVLPKPQDGLVRYSDKTNGKTTNKMITRNILTDLLGMSGNLTYGNGSKTDMGKPKLMYVDIGDDVFSKTNGQLDFDKDGNVIFDSKMQNTVAGMFDKSAHKEVIKYGKDQKEYSFSVLKNDAGNEYVPIGLKHGSVILADKDAYVKESRRSLDTFGVNVFDAFEDMGAAVLSKDRSKKMDTRNRSITPSVPFAELQGWNIPGRDKTAIVSMSDIFQVKNGDIKAHGIEGAGLIDSSYIPDAATIRAPGVKGALIPVNFKKYLQDAFGQGPYYLPTITATDEMKLAWQNGGIKEVRKQFGEDVIKNGQFVDAMKMDMLLSDDLLKSSFYKTGIGKGATHSDLVDRFFKVLEYMDPEGKDPLKGIRAVQTAAGFLTEQDALSQQMGQYINMDFDAASRNHSKWTNHINQLRRDDQYAYEHLFKNAESDEAEVLAALLDPNSEYSKKRNEAIEKAEEDRFRGKLYGRHDLAMAMAAPNAMELLNFVATKNGATAINKELVETFSLKGNGSKAGVAAAFANFAIANEIAGGRFPNNFGEQFPLLNEKDYISMMDNYGLSKSAIYMNADTIRRMGTGDFDGDTVQLLKGEFAQLVEQTFESNKDLIKWDNTGRRIGRNEPSEEQGEVRPVSAEDWANYLYRQSAAKFRLGKISNASGAIAQIASDEGFRKLYAKGALDLADQYDIDTTWIKTGIPSKWTNAAKNLQYLGSSFNTVFKDMISANESGDISKLGDFSKVNMPSIYSAQIVSMLSELQKNPLSSDAARKILAYQDKKQGLLTADQMRNGDGTAYERARTAFFRARNERITNWLTGRGFVPTGESDDELSSLWATYNSVAEVAAKEASKGPDKETAERIRNRITFERRQQEAIMQHYKQFGISAENVANGVGYAESIRKNAEAYSGPNSYTLGQREGNPTLDNASFAKALILGGSDLSIAAVQATAKQQQEAAAAELARNRLFIGDDQNGPRSWSISNLRKFRRDADKTDWYNRTVYTPAEREALGIVLEDEGFLPFDTALGSAMHDRLEHILNGRNINPKQENEKNKESSPTVESNLRDELKKLGETQFFDDKRNLRLNVDQMNKLKAAEAFAKAASSADFLKGETVVGTEQRLDSFNFGKYRHGPYKEQDIRTLGFADLVTYSPELGGLIVNELKSTEQNEEAQEQTGVYALAIERALREGKLDYKIKDKNGEYINPRDLSVVGLRTFGYLQNNMTPTITPFGADSEARAKAIADQDEFAKLVGQIEDWTFSEKGLYGSILADKAGILGKGVDKKLTPELDALRSSIISEAEREKLLEARGEILNSKHDARKLAEVFSVRKNVDEYLNELDSAYYEFANVGKEKPVLKDKWARQWRNVTQDANDKYQQLLKSGLDAESPEAVAIRAAQERNKLSYNNALLIGAESDLKDYRNDLEKAYANIGVSKGQIEYDKYKEALELQKQEKMSAYNQLLSNKDQYVGNEQAYDAAVKKAQAELESVNEITNKLLENADIHLKINLEGDALQDLKQVQNILNQFGKTTDKNELGQRTAMNALATVQQRIAEKYGYAGKDGIKNLIEDANAFGQLSPDEQRAMRLTTEDYTRYQDYLRQQTDVDAQRKLEDTARKERDMRERYGRSVMYSAQEHGNLINLRASDLLERERLGEDLARMRTYGRDIDDPERYAELERRYNQARTNTGNDERALLRIMSSQQWTEGYNRTILKHQIENDLYNAQQTPVAMRGINESYINNLNHNQVLLNQRLEEKNALRNRIESLRLGKHEAGYDAKEQLELSTQQQQVDLEIERLNAQIANNQTLTQDEQAKLDYYNTNIRQGELDFQRSQLERQIARRGMVQPNFGRGFAGRLMSRRYQNQLRLDEMQNALSGYKLQKSTADSMIKFYETKEKGGQELSDKEKTELTAMREQSKTAEGAIKAETSAMEQFKSSVGGVSAVTQTLGETFSRLSSMFGRRIFMRLLSEVTQFMKQYSEAMTSIQMITLKTGDEMDDVGTSNFETATRLKTDAVTVAQVKAGLYRQGLTDEEVEDRTDDVIKFAKVAGIKTETASKIMTTALKNGLVDSAQEAMDVLAALGDSAATTADEIQKALQKVAATVHNTGSEYNELTALLTVVLDKTQLSGNVVGTAMNTIMTRMRRVNESDYVKASNGEITTINDVDRALSRVGVSIRDENGEMKDTIQVIRELSKVWNSIDDDMTKQNIVYAMAGRGAAATNTLYSMLEGIGEDGGGELDRMLGIANGASGIVDEKYNAYLDSYNAKLQELNTTIDTLSNTIVSSGIAGVFADIGSALASWPGIIAAAITMLVKFTATMIATSKATKTLQVAQASTIGMKYGLVAAGVVASGYLLYNTLEYNARQKEESIAQRAAAEESGKWLSNEMKQEKAAKDIDTLDTSYKTLNDLYEKYGKYGSQFLTSMNSSDLLAFNDAVDNLSNVLGDEFKLNIMNAISDMEQFKGVLDEIYERALGEKNKITLDAAITDFKTRPIVTNEQVNATVGNTYTDWLATDYTTQRDSLTAITEEYVFKNLPGFKKKSMQMYENSGLTWDEYGNTYLIETGDGKTHKFTLYTDDEEMQNNMGINNKNNLYSMLKVVAGKQYADDNIDDIWNSVLTNSKEEIDKYGLVSFNNDYDVVFASVLNKLFDQTMGSSIGQYLQSQNMTEDDVRTMIGNFLLQRGDFTNLDTIMKDYSEYLQIKYGSDTGANLQNTLIPQNREEAIQLFNSRIMTEKNDIGLNSISDTAFAQVLKDTNDLFELIRQYNLLPEEQRKDKKNEIDDLIMESGILRTLGIRDDKGVLIDPETGTITSVATGQEYRIPTEYLDYYDFETGTWDTDKILSTYKDENGMPLFQNYFSGLADENFVYGKENNYIGAKALLANTFNRFESKQDAFDYLKATGNIDLVSAYLASLNGTETGNRLAQASDNDDIEAMRAIFNAENAAANQAQIDKVNATAEKLRKENAQLRRVVIGNPNTRDLNALSSRSGVDVGGLSVDERADLAKQELETVGTEYQGVANKYANMLFTAAIASQDYANWKNDTGGTLSEYFEETDNDEVLNILRSAERYGVGFKFSESDSIPYISGFVNAIPEAAGRDISNDYLPADYWSNMMLSGDYFGDGLLRGIGPDGEPLTPEGFMERYSELMLNEDTKEGLEDISSNVTGFDEVVTAAAKGSVPLFEEALRDMNNEIQRADLLRKMGEDAKDVADAMDELSKGGEHAAKALGKIRSTTNNYVDLKTAISKSRGKSGKEMDDTGKALLASYLGMDQKDIEAMTKEELAEYSDIANKAIDESFSNGEFRTTLNKGLEDISNAINLGQLELRPTMSILVNPDGTFNYDGFVSLLQQVDSDMAAEAANQAGHIGDYLVKITQSEDSSGGVKISVDSSWASLKGSDNYIRGGGGGGGGKSKFQKFMTELKNKLAVTDHEIKMIQAQETRYENRGEYENLNNMIELENVAQQKYIDKMEDAIEQIKEQMKTLKKDSDDWYTARDAIFGYEEAIEAATQAIEDNEKKIRENQQAALKAHTDVEDAIRDEANAREELRRSMLNGRVNMENDILDAIKQRYQDEWDLIQRDIDRKRQALEEEKNLINERLQARKNAEQEAEKYEQLAEYQRQLAYISMDPTRTKDQAELVKKISELQKELAWSQAEQEANAQAEQLDDQLEAFESFSNIGDERLQSYLEDANNFASEVSQILEMSFDDMSAWLAANVDEYRLALDDMQEQMVLGWKDTYEQMLNITEMYGALIELIINGGKDAFLEYMMLSDEYQKATPDMQAQMLYEWSELFDAYIHSLASGAGYEHVDDFLDGLGKAASSSSGGGGGGGNNSTSAASSTIGKSAADLMRELLAGMGATSPNSAINNWLVKSKINYAYDSGGLVDYTGPAWVDGTPMAPEAFLDAEDTALVRNFLDAAKFVSVKMSMPNFADGLFGNTNNSIGNVNITINEATISDDQDINDLAHRIGDSFVEQLSMQGFHTGNYSF